MLGRKGHACEHVSFGIVHEGTELGPSGTELVGDMPPCLYGIIVVGLDEGLADCSGNHGVLTLGNIGQCVAHRMDPASLPCCAENTGDGGLQALVSIRDDELDAGEPSAHQIAQKARPEWLGFRRANMPADDLPLPVGINSDSDYCRHGNGAPALAHLQIGGIKP
ncbi:hypothetical protein GV68_21985 [Pseudorhizobium pelagicum]|uniref:Uncharacterized protein n=1 Tax=Pseudorhizobium pelagicum TaxID=1509405 RepID=A0A922P0B1_9HYPH|nr:hypothetical protein GV68_21985 [Pseudorhizobium pelagicum]